MTVQEIISNAIVAGKDQFRAALIRQAEEHDNYALTASNPLAKRGAENQRAACLRAYDHVHFGAVNDICEDMSTCIIAVNAAAKMLGISPAKRTSAIIAWDETQKERGAW